MSFGGKKGIILAPYAALEKQVFRIDPLRGVMWKLPSQFNIMGYNW